MRNTLQSAWVGVLVSLMVIDPATACRFCGQSWGGYSSYGYSYESSCCYSPCQSCGCEGVVVSEPYGCQSCGCDGQSVPSTVPSQMSPPPTAPQPPASHPMMAPPAPTKPAAPANGTSTNKMTPSTVNKPMEPTQAPSLPPQTEPNTAMPPMDKEPSSSSLPKSTEKLLTPPQSASPADDLFGTPTKPNDAGNDLFGGATDSKPAAAPENNTFKPAEEPKLVPPAEMPSTPAADDLFGTPLSEPAAPAEKKSEPAKEPAMSAPAEGEKAAPADKDDKKKDDDLFGGFGAILREPGGLSSNEMRHWVDNTGRFTCEGRLTRVMDGQVQLLKDNGHNSTVPLGRLSENDLAFVYRQASAERTQSADQTAQYTPAMLGE